jgi:hypothetical protein
MFPVITPSSIGVGMFFSARFVNESHDVGYDRMISEKARSYDGQFYNVDVRVNKGKAGRVL